MSRSVLVVDDHPAPAMSAAHALELIARFDVTTGVPATTWWGAIELCSADGTDSLSTRVTEAGAVQGWRVGLGVATMIAASGSVSRTSGETWLRLIVTASYAAYYYGTGSGSTAPTTWTKVTQVTADIAQYARGAMAHVGLKCGRSGGSGTFTTEWRNVQTRVLGISR